MLGPTRKAHLLEHLRRHGQIVAKDLSAQLDVSEDTIRRDLRELAAKGELQRVHGGALPTAAAAADFSARERLAPNEKTAVGRAAAAMVQPGQIVALDGGTTTLQIARHLPRDLRATVITHSPNIALALGEHPFVEVVMIGGRLFKHSFVNVGAAAVEAIRHIRADLYFMGVTGIHARAGLSTGDLEECHVKRALIASAAETHVLVTAEKVDAASPYVIAKLSEIDGVVVAKDVPSRAVQAYRRLGLSVRRA